MHTTNAPAGPESAHQYLTFALGGELFGVRIDGVREILEHIEPTAIPMMPSFLRGVINLRGAVVPIVDLQARFGRGTTPVEKRSCFVIVEVEHEAATHPLGILVDAVNEVIAVEKGALEARPAFGTRLRSDFVEGVLNLEKGLVITLDTRNVLSIEEMATMIALVRGGSSDGPGG